MDATIKKNVIEVSPVRAHARLRVMRSKTLDIARRLSVPIATYEGEAETRPTDQSDLWKRADHRVSADGDDTRNFDMMVSSAFDLEQEIAFDVGQSPRPRRSEKLRLRQRSQGSAGLHLR